MNKLLIIAAVALCLLTNLAINYLTSEYAYFPTTKQQAEISLCGGASPTVPVKTIQKLGGKPFESQSQPYTTQIATCSAVTPTRKLDIERVLKTWEFYANWAIWSALIIGLVLLGRGYFANNRD